MGSIKQDSVLQSLMQLLGRFVALALCIVGFPVHLLISTIIRLYDGGPALYKCLRLGRFGTCFTLRKYRTLKRDAPHHLSRELRMVVHPRDKRLTPIGALLRCGIDELPQLWNIVKGEMTWIGPRPDPDWMLAH